MRVGERRDIECRKIHLPDEEQRVQHSPSREEVEAMAAAVKVSGRISPIVVRTHPRLPPGEYELVTGRLRLEVALHLEHPKIPTLITRLDDVEATLVSLLDDLAGKQESQLTLAWRIRETLDLTGWSQAKLSRLTRLSAGQVSELNAFAGALPKEMVHDISRSEDVSIREIAALPRQTLRSLKDAGSQEEKRRTLVDALRGSPNLRSERTEEAPEPRLEISSARVAVPAAAVRMMGPAEFLKALGSVVGWMIARRMDLRRITAKVREAK